MRNPQVQVVSPTSAVFVEKAFRVSPDAFYKVCAGFRFPIFECQKVINFLMAETVFLDVVVASEAVGVHGRAALDISRAEAFKRFGVGRLDFLYMQFPRAAFDYSDKGYFSSKASASARFFTSAFAARQIGFVYFDFAADMSPLACGDYLAEFSEEESCGVSVDIRPRGGLAGCTARQEEVY